MLSPRREWSVDDTGAATCGFILLSIFSPLPPRSPCMASLVLTLILISILACANQCLCCHCASSSTNQASPSPPPPPPPPSSSCVSCWLVRIPPPPGMRGSPCMDQHASCCISDFCIWKTGIPCSPLPNPQSSQMCVPTHTHRPVRIHAHVGSVPILEQACWVSGAEYHHDFGAMIGYDAALKTATGTGCEPGAVPWEMHVLTLRRERAHANSPKAQLCSVTSTAQHVRFDSRH